MINNLIIQIEQRVEKLLTNPSTEHALVLRELLKGMTLLLKDSKQSEALNTTNQFLEFTKNNLVEGPVSLSEELTSTIRNFVSQLKNQLTEEPKVVAPAEPKPAEPKVVASEEPKPAEPKVVAPEEPKPAEPKVVAPEEPKPAEPKVVVPEVPKPAEPKVVAPEVPKPAEPKVVAPEDEDLDAELEKLRVEYLITLPEKITEMERLITVFINQPQKKSKDELKHAVHKIAGSAGSFGFMQVSEMCLAMEKELEALADFTNIDPWREKLTAFFAKLKEEFGKNNSQ